MFRYLLQNQPFRSNGLEFRKGNSFYVPRVKDH